MKTVLSAEQISHRVKEMARQISQDYAGKTLYVVCILENGFLFAADLVRQLEVPVVCLFMKAVVRQLPQREQPVKEIFYTPSVEVKSQHVLLVEGIIQSGVTQEFLVEYLRGRGAASVRLASFLDRQSGRRVSLQPDYFGYLLDEAFVIGYGLGDPLLSCNLAYVATANSAG